MKKDFQALEKLLFDCNTSDSNGKDIWADVHGLLIELGGKIDEVEKRIECAKKCSDEIVKAIIPYQDAVDNGREFTMTVPHYDTIKNSADDVRIALDLGDDMAVIDNWYNLFSPIANENKFHVGESEDEETYPIVNCLDCGYPQPLLEENVHVDSMGRHMVCESCESSFNIGGDEIAPTMQCVNTHTFDKVKEVIQILKTLDNGDCVDGETMEYILTQVGMQDQMLKQLFPLVSNDELDELLDIRNEYNSAMMSKGKV